MKKPSTNIASCRFLERVPYGRLIILRSPWKVLITPRTDMLYTNTSEGAISHTAASRQTTLIETSIRPHASTDQPRQAFIPSKGSMLQLTRQSPQNNTRMLN